MTDLLLVRLTGTSRASKPIVPLVATFFAPPRMPCAACAPNALRAPS